MNRPVIGPAGLRMGSWAGKAATSKNSGCTADWVRPKLNWTPKKPRFIISSALVVISGLRSSSPEPGEKVSDVVIAMATPIGRRDPSDPRLTRPALFHADQTMTKQSPSGRRVAAPLLSTAGPVCNSVPNQQEERGHGGTETTGCPPPVAQSAAPAGVPSRDRRGGEIGT